MGISSIFSDITKIERTANNLVQFWQADTLEFVVSVKGNVQVSPDRTYLIVTDEDGTKHNAYIYDLVQVVIPLETQAFIANDPLTSPLSDENIGVKINLVYDYLTEKVFEGCCGGGGDGSTMLYRVYEDGTLIEEIAAFSTEDQTININWV